MSMGPTKKRLLEILPDSHVDDLVEVVDGATSYWLLHDPLFDYLDAPDNVQLHGIDVVEDEGKTVTITTEQIREAYGKLLDLDQDLVGSMIHGYIIDSYRDRDKETQLIDLGHIDGDAYDAIMQVAAFGELVYG